MRTTLVITVAAGLLAAVAGRPAAAAEAAAAVLPGDLPASRAVLDRHEAASVLGRPVRGSTGQMLGRIVDVVTDPEGRVRAAVIDFGGFLGVGDRKIAVDWAALLPVPDAKDGAFTVDLTRNQIKDAPEYKTAGPVVIIGSPFGIGGSGTGNTAAGR